MARQTYEMEFQLQAQLGSKFSSTFSSAQKELAAMQQEIQELSKVQDDISAYQKQQDAAEATRQKLSVLQQQYDNIQQEIQQTEEYSSSLENKLLSKKLQIDNTTASLGKQERELQELGESLKDAGVDMDDLGKSSEQLSADIDELKQAQTEAAEGAETFGERADAAFSAASEAVAAAGIATALKEIYEYFQLCAQASMDFESAMTGVAKTTDLTDEEFEEMSAAIQDMSTELPTSANDIAAVVESAGQLGIAKENLLDFASVMVDLGETTNLTADEAASDLAKFANVVDMSAEDYDELGSVIVDLGNHFATTEADIVSMATRLASSGSIVGLSESEIMAVAAALSSVGVEAEAGGSAISKLLKQFETMVQTGSDSLEDFASVAGMSAEDFSAAWQQDAIGTLSLFIDGLHDIDESGGSSVAVLEELGITETRLSNAVLALSSSSGILNTALETANTAWEENTALTNEANKRYGTTESQLSMMKNAYTRVTVAIGDAYTPALKEAYSVGTSVLNSIANFIEQNPELVNAIGAFVAVMGTAIAIVTAYRAATKIAAAASALLSSAIPGVNIIMGVATAVAAVAAAVALVSTDANDAVPSVSELTEAAQGMQEAMSEANTAYADTATSTTAAANVAETYIAKLEEMEAAGVDTAEEQEQYHNILQLLCQTVPDLADCIDLETDTIEGGTEALRANTEAWKENAIAQAYQEQLTELYSQYSSVLVEAEENSLGLTKAQLQLDEAEKKLSTAQARMTELWDEASAKAQEEYEKTGMLTDASAYLSDEYYELESSLTDLSDEVWNSQKTVEAYNEAIAEDQEAVAAAEDEISLAEEAVESLTAALGDGSDAASEAAAEQEAMQEQISANEEQIEALTESYNELYEAAQESISGQFELWDEAAEVVATDSKTITSNLQSQISYWKNYNTNLQNLNARTDDIEGLSTMIASFADGSSDSVNAIAGMAAASDTELAAMVEDWEALQIAQETAGETIADITLDYEDQVDALEDKNAELQGSTETMAESRIYAAAEQEAAAQEAAEQEIALQDAIHDTVDKIEELTEAYNEAYEAALTSIEGQYNLWDEAAEVVATSAGTINSNLQSQITYWQQYNSNLESLGSRASEIEGLSDMIASFADGSTDSVNAIAGMASASDEDLATMVANWQTLQTEQEEAAGSIADLKTDFTTTMDELQSELDADIAAMDLGESAAQSGKSTIQGFINGATEMLPQVQAAYSKIAQAAVNAIDAKLEIHSPSRVMAEKAEMTWAGYINETEAMQPEVEEAMASAVGAGADTVTQEDMQIAAFAPQLLAALSARGTGASIGAEIGGYGGGNSVQVTFQIEGNATPETVEALRDYGDEFAERVIEVMREAGIDTARRSYT